MAKVLNSHPPEVRQILNMIINTRHNQTGWIVPWQSCKRTTGMPSYLLIQSRTFLFGVNVPQLLVANNILGTVLVIKSFKFFNILLEVVRHGKWACRI